VPIAYALASKHRLPWYLNLTAAETVVW